MGKASRWLKSLLGMKKDKENTPKTPHDKRRSSFARPTRDSTPQIPLNIPRSAWLGDYLSASEKDQNKHAIAVAAATAAAADAAVAAAHAAVAVVRLTSHSRGAALFSAGRDNSAAVLIQTVFRGYLARKALRALKGLVKLQAHVRGYLVRKQATATLHSMQALVRAQASARAHRARRSDGSARPRRSIEEPRSEFHSKRIYDQNYDDNSPKIVEIDTYKPRSRSCRRMSNNNNPPSSVSDYGDYPVSSPLPAPARISVPNRCDWGVYKEEEEERQCHYNHHRMATTHSTPRCANTARAYHRPSTPAKSVCGEGYYRPYYQHHLSHHSGNYFPNYMSNTQSFRAKVRSHSAPRQRPDASPSMKRMSLNEVMASRSSVSGVRTQRQRSFDVQQTLFSEV